MKPMTDEEAAEMRRVFTAISQLKWPSPEELRERVKLAEWSP